MGTEVLRKNEGEMSPDGQMIRVEELVKVYPGGTRALGGIGFAVGQGEFFGLLGPNGAGTSTALKVLSTLLKKTSGRVLVAGHDVDHDPLGVRRSIGFAMQEVGLDDLATGRDFLVLQGLLYGQSTREAKRRAAELLELVGLTDVAGRKVGTYSGGMRRRIDLVAALMHHPPLLFLDEPTTGLDPQSRLAIWEHLEHLNRQGTTVVLTTQTMEEADRLCQRIAIIDRGQIIIEGSPTSLKEDVGGEVITITVDSTDSGGRPALLARAAALAREHSYVVEDGELGDSLTVSVRDSQAAVPDLLRLLHENGIGVKSLALASPTLDDVFLKHTGHKIRTESTGGEELAQAMRPWLGLRRK